MEFDAADPRAQTRRVNRLLSWQTEKDVLPRSHRKLETARFHGNYCQFPTSLRQPSDNIKKYRYICMMF